MAAAESAKIPKYGAYHVENSCWLFYLNERAPYRFNPRGGEFIGN